MKIANRQETKLKLETGDSKLAGVNMKEIYEMDVYRLAEELSDKIWYEVDKWNEKAKRTTGYQIIRSSDSIATNIAEGFGRYTPKDRKLFYRYARGSFEETKAWLRKTIRRGIITKKTAKEYSHIINELGPKLNAFIKSTDNIV
ncbi:four helix bundle protein [Chlamydiota bacterium]